MLQHDGYLRGDSCTLLQGYIAQRQDPASIVVELGPVVDDSLAEGGKVLDLLLVQLGKQLAQSLIELLLPWALICSI